MEKILTKRPQPPQDIALTKRQRLNPENELIVKQQDDHVQVTCYDISAKIPILKDNSIRVKKETPLKNGGLKNLINVAQMIMEN